VATPYSKTLRSLKSDSSRPWILVSVVGALFLGSGIAWALLVEIGVWVTSEHARIEAADGGHPVEAEVAGTVSRVEVRVGERVQAGTVLVELDGRSLRLQAEEERSTAEGLDDRLAFLERKLEAERVALHAAERERAAALEEERAWLAEARARLRFATSEAARAKELHKAGLLSDAELEKAGSEERQRRAALTASEVALSRLKWVHRDQESERKARIHDLEAHLAGLHGDLARAGVTIRRLEREIARYSARAPVAGVVAEVAALRPGEFVSPGDRLATIVPDGGFRIVAWFSPADGLGRLRPGQPAVVRLHGFPWTEFGTVPAAVTRVASELRGDLVEVELRAVPSPGGSPRLSHGLPATVEVQIEAVSPAALALRAAGGGGTATSVRSFSRAGG